MFKHHFIVSCVATTMLLGYAGISAAEDYGDTIVRRGAYERAAGDRVASIPGTQQLVDTDALGRRKIAFYTSDGNRPKVWLLTTDADCGEPKLIGSRIVSAMPDGTAKSCSVDRIQPVHLFRLQMALGDVHTATAYGAYNLWFNNHDQGSYHAAAAMGRRR